MTSLLTHPELSMKPVIMISPQSISSTSVETAAGIDTLGFDGFILIPSVGALGDDVDATMTECATLGGTYLTMNDEADTPVAVDFLFLDGTDEDTVQIGFFRLDRRLRFIKVDMESAAGISLVGCVLVLISARDSVNQDVTYAYKL